MTVRTFGRKGFSGGEPLGRRETPFGQGPVRPASPPEPAPTADDAEMARRREAFIAEERARKATLAGAPPAGEPGSAANRPVHVPEKSMGLAFVLWFVLGAVGAHRFYLGFPVSGVIMASVWFVSWVMLLGGFPVATLGLLFAGFWILTDCIVIPSLCRKANERARQHAAIYAFS